MPTETHLTGQISVNDAVTPQGPIKQIIVTVDQTHMYVIPLDENASKIVAGALRGVHIVPANGHLPPSA